MNPDTNQVIIDNRESLMAQIFHILKIETIIMIEEKYSKTEIET